MPPSIPPGTGYIAPTESAQSGAAHPARPDGIDMATPFPWPAMMAISIVLVTHSYALTSLFPYVGYMVQHLGAADDKDEAGFYAGYLSSAFMAGRFGSSYVWGRIADRYGRLPVVYVGLWSIAFLSVAFGLSTTFVWAVACRFLLGATNGLMGVGMTMISEVCGREHEVVGMSFITGCWSVGLVLGSGLGGLLAEPANHYPDEFSETGLFGRFPYLLPNILGAGLALAGLPPVYFFLKETLDVNKHGDRRGFEPLRASEAELRNQKAAMDGGGGFKVINIDNGHDPELAKADPARSQFANNGGSGGGEEAGGGTPRGADKIGYETVGNDGRNGSSAHTRAEERIPLAGRRSKSSSGVQDREGEKSHSSVHGGAYGSSWSGGGDIGQGGGGDAGSGEGLGGGKMRNNAYMREFLLPFRLLEEKRVRTILSVFVVFSLTASGYREVYPLWAISTLARGGLDWTTTQIGQALSACGGGMLIFQLMIYPPIVKKIGAKKSQRWACCVAIPVFLAYPFLPRLHDSEGALLAASLVLLFLTNMATNAVVINFALATNNAVDPSKRGTVNGLSMMLGSLARATGPTAASTTFAWSIQHRHPFPFDQHLIFCLLALGMVIITVVSWNIVISPVEQKPKGAADAVLVVMAKDVPEEDRGIGLSSGR